MIEIDKQDASREELELMQEEDQEALIIQNEEEAGLSPCPDLDESDFLEDIDYDELEEFAGRNRSPIMIEMEKTQTKVRI